MNKKEVQIDLKQAKNLEVMTKTEGGKLLQQTMQTDVINTLDAVLSSYKTATHAELLALCASLSAQISLLRVFANAPNNTKIIEEVLSSLEDAPEMET